MAGLGNVPPDVLELIAYHAAVESTVRPPAGLLSLLLVDRRTHAVLQPSALPHLYASIFRATFDLPALHRRLPKSRLTSPRLALELQRRWAVLKLLRNHPPAPEAESSDARAPSRRPSHDEVLWVTLLMCLENDGRNLFLLRNYGRSSSWISAIAGRAFARHSTRPGAAFLPARMSIEARAIPTDTVEVALTVWLFWYLKGKGDLRGETQLEKERNRTMLRVFVFAAQLFDAHMQPWTLGCLPLPLPDADPSSSPTATSRSPEIDQPFLADLSPRPLTVTIPYFGADLDIGKPNACWAGMMSFFLRTTIRRDAEDDEDEDEEARDDGLAPPAGPTHPFGPTAPQAPAAVQGASHSPIMQHAPRESLAFDLEWDRLISCREPFASAPSSTAGQVEEQETDERIGTGNRGLGIWKVRGTFDGVWGGEFAFLDFDSYRDMLSGRDRVIYEGAFGIQPQIFRVQERLVQRAAGTPPPTSSEATPSLNAFFPADFTFPFSLASPTGEEVTGVPGYTNVSAGEEARLRASGTQAEVDRLELVLSGTGHSAWGRFNLSGRVRLWDGLVYLLKDYSPESRGRWLYRGYVVGGGTMVGRWRDTFSPEIYSGYEGSFHMTRRG